MTSSHVSLYIYSLETIFSTIRLLVEEQKKIYLKPHPRCLNVVFFSRLGRLLYLERTSNASARNKYIKKRNTLRKYTLLLFFFLSLSSFFLSVSLSLSYLFPLHSYSTTGKCITVSLALKHPTCLSGLKSLNVSPRLGLENT